MKGTVNSRRLTRLWLCVAVVVSIAGCSSPPAEPDDASLRASFADRISTSSFVSDFARDGDDLAFTGPDGQGGTAAWRVQIDSSLVEPNDLDETQPYIGRVTSTWYADDDVVEYLGSMSALPEPFLERGLGQECWAYWIAAEHRWDW